MITTPPPTRRYTMRIFRPGQTHPIALATYTTDDLSQLCPAIDYWAGKPERIQIIDNETGREVDPKAPPEFVVYGDTPRRRDAPLLRPLRPRRSRADRRRVEGLRPAERPGGPRRAELLGVQGADSRGRRSARRGDRGRVALPLPDLLVQGPARRPDPAADDRGHSTELRS